MKLIFMYGPPASGKLTVARELAALTGYRLFHNHLVVDALGAVFEFGSEPFVELRERIWLDVLEKAACSGIDGVIFTFAPERSVGQEFVGTLRRQVAAAGGDVLFVRLDCADDEIERRLGHRSRRQSGKLTSVKLYRELKAEGVFDAPVMPEPALVVDSDTLSAGESARLIAAELRLA